jgi:hypothetical protein
MEEIKSKTQELLNIVDNSIQWAQTMDDKLSQNSVVNSIKNIRRSLVTISNSVNKRPSIAIFGQSQVGKSYLIQNLTKHESSKFLKIKVSEGHDELNFLTDINPDGGRESTGLVTRFTTKDLNSDPSYPFKLDLFGQLDIASILVNSFWNDLKDFDEGDFSIDIDEIKNKFSHLTNHENINSGITEDDTYFFCKYVEENFKDVFLVRELKKIGYFSEVQHKLHKIDSSKSWEILNILWGRNKFITEIFKLLTNEIIRLQFSKEVEVEINAITPNSQTILDVERVRELFDDDIEDDLISIKLSNGKVLNCQRSIISVLTKEVQLQIAYNFEEKSVKSFLNTADILDFPGSKSREKIPLSVFNTNTTIQKLQLLIRGKVSYLFDTYTQNLGVSSLLYCMDDNPPEEKEAPSRLYKWVKRYVGDSIEDRTIKLEKTKEILKKNNVNIEVVSPLLIILTKFNQEINKVIPGKETSIETHDSKWYARIEENFVNFMLRPVEDKWINSWTENNRDFNFIFPVRDPMYSQATFDGYEVQQAETKIRPEREEAMRSMKISFHGSEIVNNYILNPKELWSEISSPNGTGINYLSKHLINSSHQIVTQTRLELDLDKLKKDLLVIISNYRISGDITVDLKKARFQALKSITTLSTIANRNDNALSKLLANLVITDTEIWNILYDFIFGTEIESESDFSSEFNLTQSLIDLGLDLSKNTSKESIMNQLRIIYEGLDDSEINEIVRDAINIDVESISKIVKPKNKTNSVDRISDLIISYWIDKVMNKGFENEFFNKINENQREAFRSIISEIVKGRELLLLKSTLNKSIKDLRAGSLSNMDLDLVASCSTTILNKFLFTAGWGFIDNNERPNYMNSNLKIFDENGSDTDIANLNYLNDNSEKLFLKQWSYGSKLLYEENVKYEYGVEKNFNNTSNTLLVDIISKLEN